MYLLMPFILQNFKKILRAELFWYKPLLLLSSTYWPFSLCKVLKKFLQRIQSYEDASFLGPKWFICSRQFFLWKILLISFSSTYWPLSFCEILKRSWKFLKPIQIYENVPQFFLNKTFGTNHYYYFHLSIGPFHWAKF